MQYIEIGGYRATRRALFKVYTTICASMTSRSVEHWVIRWRHMLFKGEPNSASQCCSVARVGVRVCVRSGVSARAERGAAQTTQQRRLALSDALHVVTWPTK